MNSLQKLNIRLCPFCNWASVSKTAMYRHIISHKCVIGECEHKNPGEISCYKTRNLTLQCPVRGCEFFESNLVLLKCHYSEVHGDRCKKCRCVPCRCVLGSSHPRQPRGPRRERLEIIQVMNPHEDAVPPRQGGKSTEGTMEETLPPNGEDNMEETPPPNGGNNMEETLPTNGGNNMEGALEEMEGNDQQHQVIQTGRGGGLGKLLEAYATQGSSSNNHASSQLINSQHSSQPTSQPASQYYSQPTSQHNSQPTSQHNSQPTSQHNSTPTSQPINSQNQQQQQQGPWRRWDSEPPTPSSPQPGPSHTRKPVEDDERAAYYMLRDRMCPYCPMSFDDKTTCQQHCVNAHPDKCTDLDCSTNTDDPLDLYLARSAIQNTYRVYEVNLSNVEVEDIHPLFISIKKRYHEVVKEMLKMYRNFKMQFRIKCQFYREDAGVVTHAFVPMESFNFIVENEHYSQFAFKMALSNFDVRIEDFQENGSGWIFQRVNEFSILFSEYRPFTGSGNIPLPFLLKGKRRSLLNVPSDDSKYFLRCLIAAMYKDEVKGDHRKRTLSSRHFYDIREERVYNDLKLDGIDFPFDIKQAAKYERQNPDIGLNIFLYDETPDEVEKREKENDIVPDAECDEEVLNYDVSSDKSVEWRKELEEHKELKQNIYPIKICKEERKRIIDIMLVQNGDEGHYILIENLLSLLKYPHSRQKHICRYCLQTFNKMADIHQQYCAALGRMRTDFPFNSTIHWEKYKNMIPHYFIGAMDFESRLLRINVTKGNTRKVKKHKASGYAWVIVDEKGNRKSCKKYVAFKEEEVVAEQMLLELLDEANKVTIQIKDWNEEANKKAEIFKSQAPPFQAGQKCGFCKNPIKKEDAVRHHKHTPPFNFEFYAHKDCNFKAYTSDKLVVLAHNLRSYDSHFLIKACAKKSVEHKMEVIGSSSEKFFAIFVGDNLMFIDSLNFFSSSLEAVAASMDKEKDFPISTKYFMEMYNDMSKVQLMLRKGVYPYDYFDDLSKYDETELPPPEEFFDSLSNRPVDLKDYEHAQKVWKELEVKDLREYTEIYNMSDVLLLLDCFNKLREIFLKNFELDPAHYFSLPHLSWECCLKHSNVYLSLITDETMLCWLESSIRGGVASGLEYRAAKANNPYLPDYDPSKPSSYIMVHDVNNLYGSSLCSFLPFSEFKWIPDEELDNIRKDPKIFFDGIMDDAEFGYFVEVDLEFPMEIHDKLKGLTPVPYKRATEFEEYSPGQQKLAINLGVAENTMKATRLLADLHPRENYIVHYRALKFYLSLGIKLTKVHRGISFKQKAVFRDYINTLAEWRKNAPTKFEQNMWKLGANSIYGKSVECVRNRCRFVIVKDREKALKYNRKPNVSQVILLDSENDGEDIAIIRMKKLSVYLDRPTYLGITVLDESKKILYEWYYNYALPKYGNKIYTLATDTDSVISIIETENVYEDMWQDRHAFDMSDYDPKSEIWGKYYCEDNRKRLGLMKEELCNKVASSFIFLRPKMYMYDCVKPLGPDEDGKPRFERDEVKKAKGLNRQCVRDHITKDDYLETLEKEVVKSVPCTSIRSERHNIYTMVLTKRGLSSFEQKRYVLPDNISTLPFGHYMIAHEDNAPKAKRARLEIEDVEDMREMADKEMVNKNK